MVERLHSHVGHELPRLHAVGRRRRPTATAQGSRPQLHQPARRATLLPRRGVRPAQHPQLGRDSPSAGEARPQGPPARVHGAARARRRPGRRRQDHPVLSGRALASRPRRPLLAEARLQPRARDRDAADLGRRRLVRPLPARHTGRLRGDARRQSRAEPDDGPVDAYLAARHAGDAARGNALVLHPPARRDRASSARIRCASS